MDFHKPLRPAISGVFLSGSFFFLRLEWFLQILQGGPRSDPYKWGDMGPPISRVIYNPICSLILLMEEIRR